MAGLTATRQALATDLAIDGITVFDHVPPAATPPAIILAPGQPFLTYGQTFGHGWDALWWVYLVVGTAENQQATEQLETLLEAVLDRLGDAQPEKIPQPVMVEVNGQLFYGLRLEVSTQVTPTRED